MHIISNENGLYMVTSNVDSQLYFVSRQGEIHLINSYNKVTYVYTYKNNSIFIPCLYYGAYGYKNDEVIKYKTKANLLEGNHNAVCTGDSVYYYTRNSSCDAKIWCLDLETGVNEEVQLNIPKRKKRRLRYSYINVCEDKLCVIYYYFDEKDVIFDDMFIGIYEKKNSKYELISEKLIERGVRNIKCKYSEEIRENVLLFTKMERDGHHIRVKQEYLGTLDKNFVINNIFEINEHIDNGVNSFAISMKKRYVVVLWSKKVCVYNMDTGIMICDLSNRINAHVNANAFYDVNLEGGILLVASDTGVWEFAEDEYLGV